METMAVDAHQVREAISQRLKVSRELITDDALFTDDLGADSVDIVDLLMDFESMYGIDISEEESENLTRVGDLIKYLKSVVKK
jgi:acyl carrier protein